MFDAEAVAIDTETAKLLPFQELSRRKRKDVKVEDIKVRVCLFAFDLLYLNGKVRSLCPAPPFSCSPPPTAPLSRSFTWTSPRGGRCSRSISSPSTANFS